jgi:hypothetical protein
MRQRPEVCDNARGFHLEWDSPLVDGFKDANPYSKA